MFLLIKGRPLGSERVKKTISLNPFTLKSDLIDFTLSNARRFYLLKGDPLGVKGLSDFFWFFLGVQVHKGITIVLSLFRSHRLVVVYCLVLCSGSCGPVLEDRTLFLVKFFFLQNFLLHVLFNFLLKHPPCILLPVFFF